MRFKILSVFICAITLFQLAALAPAGSAFTANSKMLWGDYTAAMGCVNGLVSSGIPLGDQIRHASRSAQAQDTLTLVSLARRSGDSFFKPLQFSGIFSSCITNGGLISAKSDRPDPPGRSPQIPLYVLLFAVVLALSNLPAPVLCLGCLGNPAICRSRVFLFGEIA